MGPPGAWDGGCRRPGSDRRVCSEVLRGRRRGDVRTSARRIQPAVGDGRGDSGSDGGWTGSWCSTSASDACTDGGGSTSPDRLTPLHHPLVIIRILFVKDAGRPAATARRLATTEETMSAAPHEIGASAPALAVVPDPAAAAAPSLAQLLSRRTAAPQGYDQGRPRIVPQVVPAGRPAGRPRQAAPQAAPQAARQAAARQAAARQTPRQSGCSHGAQAGPMRGLREPTFDELVTGYGRHRGPQQPEPPTSLLRRLALRARLLPTPARRPPAPRHLEPVKNGEAQLPPSWEQLLTGTHPSFRPPVSAQRGGRGPARHGRGRWRPDDESARPVRQPRVVAGERRHGLGRRRPVDRRGRGRRDADRFPRGWSPALTAAAPASASRLCVPGRGRSPPRTRRRAVHRAGRCRRTRPAASPTTGHRRDRPEVVVVGA